MSRRSCSQHGQGLVELVALVPVLLLVVLVAWALASGGYTWVLAGGAARAGARAAEVGASPAAAARAVLPLRYERDAVVIQPRDGHGLRVHLIVPTLLPLLPRFGLVGPDAGPR